VRVKSDKLVQRLPRRRSLTAPRLSLLLPQLALLSLLSQVLRRRLRQ